MATTTISDLIALCEQIRTNAAVGSNTNELVGSTMKAIVEQLRDLESQNSGPIDLNRISSNAFGPIAENGAKLVKSGTIWTAVNDVLSRISNMQNNLLTLSNEIGAAKASASSAQGKADLVEAGLQALEADVEAKETALQDSIGQVRDALNTLLNGNVSEAIENFNEVLDFLAGITDDETLSAKLLKLSDDITALNNSSTDHGKRITALETEIEGRWLKLADLESVLDGVSSQTEYAERVQRFQGTHDLYVQRGTTKYKVGEVKMYTDASLHQLTQEVCSNMILNEDGSLLTTHIDGESTVFCRHYNFNAANNHTGSEWLPGSWSAWKKKNDYEAAIQTLQDEMQGISKVAGVYNVTVEKPLEEGFYTLSSAAGVALAEGKNVIGLILSFAIGPNNWKTYQYVGNSPERNDWLTIENWKDFGSLAEGSETYIVVDQLCGTPDEHYTLSTAIDALVAYQERTKVAYAKRGLIIAYSTARNTFETKQFQGDSVVGGFGNASLWKDFGGGGSLVETDDTPAPNGTDAFSTGGAYRHLPVALDLDDSDEGIVKLQLKNEAGQEIGDQVTFRVGTGTGTDSGTVIAIDFAQKPLYGKAGGEFKVRAAIRSVTKVSAGEIENSISEVKFINRTTRQTVAYFKKDQSSSSSMSDFSFDFDLSNLCVTAGEQQLQMHVTDDEGHTSTKNISLIAVDVTCESTQTLHYTRDTSLEAGGVAKSLSMFRFPNFHSDQGIDVTVEMFVENDWKVLSTINVMDSNPYMVRIDPSSLSHGAYPLRIQGVDHSSGVRGNVLHTSVMVISQDEHAADYNRPLVVARWSDENAGKYPLLTTLNMDVACYQNGNPQPSVVLSLANLTKGTTESLGTREMDRSTDYTVVKRLTNYDQGDSLSLSASCEGVSQPEAMSFAIDGSLLPIAETEGAYFSIDLSERSNSDADKSITSDCSDGINHVEILVNGSNYSSNGFVKDSYGTELYGTETDKGRMALRIAEDVTANSNIKPFSNPNIEQNGAALSFTTMTKNYKDPAAILMQCNGQLMGFRLTGEELLVYSNGYSGEVSQDAEGHNTSTTAMVPYSTETPHRFDIVVEPSRLAPYSGIGVIKIFKDGDEAGALRYTAGAFPTNEAVLEWDGREGDIYLYKVQMWNTYYNFVQAFRNYLLSLTDTEAMIEEYTHNLVLGSVTAEGVTKDRPTLQACLNAGLMCVVLTKNPDTEDLAKNYPDYLEGLDGDKKTDAPLDWYAYFPDRPWQDFVSTAVPTTNQGTTSSWRKIKNKKAKHKKGRGIRLIRSREEIAEMFPGNAEVLAKYDLAAEMASKCKVQIVDGGQFTDINCIKVDYSDSCGAHNGAMMELMNDTQMALGADYMTPAQVFNKGTFPIHTSIDSVPCALFRTDLAMGAEKASNPLQGYFHAKANFNADKGDASFYGFEHTSGYNQDCLNYGDFYELVAGRGQTLAAFLASQDKTQWEFPIDASKPEKGNFNVVVLSEFCGDGHRVFRRAEAGSAWKETTGTMTFDASSQEWIFSGDVVNPVECYEYLKYDKFCWCQDVNSIDDMLAIDPATSQPLWLSYYESRYPDDKALTSLYEQGKKVPYQLFRWLHFCQQCNHHLTEADGDITLDGQVVSGTAENRLLKWQHELHNYANVKSTLCYTVASDYKAAVDQRSKNMMISFYKDTDSVMRAYFNHWYDGDCVDRSDNDCGLTIPWDMNATISHLYQGWDSVMFRQTYAADAKRQPGAAEDAFWLNDDGSRTVTLHDVAAAMRHKDLTWNGHQPFSPDGCYYYWVTKRLSKWAKLISSFDGERKYIQNSTAASNYFYALHGLRLDDLPDYQRKRFKYCDGQYQVGDLYKNPFSARMMGPIAVTITAAQDGFFGLGEDQADTCADSCHLLAGETATLRANVAQESGKMIYIFGADKLKVLDISSCTVKNEAFSLEHCTLLEELIIGGANYSPAYSTGLQDELTLGSMPFLRKIDIRNTSITSVDASRCPRLRQVLATDSPLRSLSVAEASPVNDLRLPATLTEIKWVGLPSLAYTGLNKSSGVRVPSLAEVVSVRIERCPEVNVVTLLKNLYSGQSSSLKLENLRISGQSLSGSADELLNIMHIGGSSLKGKDAAGVTQAKPVVNGTYGLTVIRDQEEVNALQAYYEGLTIETTLAAFVALIDEVNGESFGGVAEVDTVTADNIGDLAFLYYNGESYDEYYENYVENEY